MKHAYPRWLHPNQTLDGSKRLIQNAMEEETWTGVKMNEDGTPCVELEAPTASLQEVAANLSEVLSTYDPSLGQAPTSILDLPKSVDHEAVAESLGL